MIAALYVETGGCYFGIEGVDPWDVARDARSYAGPHPVVAHPPCQRWGRYWHGSPRKPHQYRLGEDGGCFAAALTAVRNYGGVLEHPKDSLAWGYFGLLTPPPCGGWIRSDHFGGWSCCVAQGRYGHFSNKQTWLYAVRVQLPSLPWGRGPRQFPQHLKDKYVARGMDPAVAHLKARRAGMIGAVGGKDKARIRAASPPAFRDLLLSIARTAHAQQEAA